ncbi:protein kinase [Streptomyces sp. NPDC058746]|uniref:serine/threonine-protein kinase n=1 Tax=Streptomyces sp. NPDC058746 TaxID=3346622 RepID=UPI0036A36F89
MRVGDVLAGRYRLDRRLGQGGMGEVWRAHDDALDRPVAVKVLLEAVTGDEVAARFRREATIGARLQHPGITVVHDVGQEDGRLFIVMELLAGEDLASVLARARSGLAVDIALGLAAQTAEALAAAHEQGVVHRDLKPSNLFLLPGGRVKICDFGIAHSSDATVGWTVTGRAIGTPAYMAPEQCLGGHVDARSDLYALGCVLYALLTGQPPFGLAENAYVLMHRQVEEAPRPPGLAPALDRLVLSLLAKAPTDRPESAESTGRTLRGLIGAGGAPAYVPTAVDAGTSRDPGPAVGAYGPPPVLGTPDSPELVREFVRGLLAEVEASLRAAPGSGDLRVKSLAVAADAAARFDAALAGRLLAEAERCAWTDGGSDGARVATLLTVLARQTSWYAPARTARVLDDAQQALFTVFGSNREGPLRKVAEELAAVAPERGMHLALHQIGGQAAMDRVLARAAVSAARTGTGPVRTEEYLSRIHDAGVRTAAESDAAGAVAARDLPAALRLAEGIGHPVTRALAQARAARARAAAGDPEGAATALERAGQTFSLAARERAAELRETAAGLAERGQLVQAERLRGQAENMLRADLDAGTRDPEIEGVAAALAEARRRLAEGPRAALDPATARERAATARAAHPEGPHRAHTLARIARQCVAGESAPWLAEVAADPGTAPEHAPVAASGADAPPRPVSARLQGLSGVRRWHTSAAPGSVSRAGEGVAWLAGGVVGSVRIANGATLWMAAADAGVPAQPLSGPTSVALATDPGRSTVCVAVERRDGPGVRLLAREPSNGRVRWWRELPGETVADPSDPARLTTAGNLVLYAGREAVTALGAATGEEAWRYQGPFDGTPGMTPGPDCLVLAERAGLTGLHLRNGALLWPRGGPDHAVAHPASVPVGPVHVLAGSTLHALHQRTGLPLWSIELGVPAPGLLAEGGAVYAAWADPQTRANSVVAVDAESGRELWRRRLAGPGGSRSCVLELLGTRAGLLYVKSAVGNSGLFRRQPGTGFLTGLDLATGKPRWHWEHPGISHRGAVLHGDVVVLPLPELTSIALP